MIWIVFAVMTGVAVLCVLWPLAWRGAGGSARATDLAFYKSAIAGIDGDVERGLVCEQDAAGARAEAARRLLATDTLIEPSRPAVWVPRIAALAALVLVPAITLGLYTAIGHPDYADRPLAARLDASPGDMDIMAAVAKIERHLEQEPDDARGWDVLAPVYLKLGQQQKAAEAFGNLIRLEGPSPERATDLGVALTAAADGRVTPDAVSAFETASALDPAMPQPRFYRGLAAEQAGDIAKATDLWGKLVAEAPPQAPWVPMVRQRLAALTGAAPSPQGEMAASVAALPADQQQVAIRGMVEQLAARLARQGGSEDEWARLVRAYSVLHEPERARAALADARKALAEDPAAAARLATLARDLGIGG